MENSLYLQVLAQAKKTPHNEAMRFEHTLWNYRTMMKKIQETARRVASLGLKKGETVIVSLPNCPLALTLLYAINALGMVSYNVHPLTKPDTMLSYFTKSGAKAIFTLSLYASSIREKIPKDVPVIGIDPYKHIDPIKSLVYQSKIKEKNKDVIDYFSLKKAASFAHATVDKEDDAVYLNTGGTNGDPKIVRLSNRAINYLALQGYHLIGGDVRKIHILTAIPLFHGFGLAMGVHTPLVHGASTVLMLSFHRKPAISLIRSGKATVIIGVPALYEALLSKKEFYGPHLRKQIIAWIGGDNVQQSLLDRYNKAMQDNGSTSRLYEGYGLTETSTAINVNYHASNRKGSVGKPLPGISEIIVDLVTGKKLMPHEPGEILIDSPTGMSGYLHDEKTTEASYRVYDGHRYLKTGDYGYLDEDGFLYFRQRMRRIVKVNGESLCPVDVEKVVEKNPHVNEAFCYGVKDKRKGHVLSLACSVMRNNPPESREALKEELRKLLKEKLPENYQPQDILIMDDLPHTPIGKIDATKFPRE